MLQHGRKEEDPHVAESPNRETPRDPHDVEWVGVDASRPSDHMVKRQNPIRQRLHFDMVIQNPYLRR